MTEQYPDDVEAWIELAQILEQTDIQVYKRWVKVHLFHAEQLHIALNPSTVSKCIGCSFSLWHSNTNTSGKSTS